MRTVTQRARCCRRKWTDGRSNDAALVKCVLELWLWHACLRVSLRVVECARECSSGPASLCVVGSRHPTQTGLYNTCSSSSSTRRTRINDGFTDELQHTAANRELLLLLGGVFSCICYVTARVALRAVCILFHATY